MHDNFDEGHFEYYDATDIQIVAPKAFSGLELSIYHTDKVHQDSLWRTIGQWINFNIDKDDLVSSMTLFDGAVSNLCAHVRTKFAEQLVEES